MTVNLFDVNFYRFANRDLASAGLTTDAQLTNHFRAYGLNEGRRFSAVADVNFYRASNPDLAVAGLRSNAQLLTHMQRYGVAQGRAISAFVSLNFYLVSNPDVNSATGGNREAALSHLRTYGINEGRSFSEFVDINAYLNYNPDVKQAYNSSRVQSLNHLEVYGVNEGRQFSPFVDVVLYLSNYADLKQAFGTNRTLALTHLETTGINEGRRFAAGFDVNYYRAANPDLAVAGLNTNLFAYRHWVQYGFNEGRFALPDPGTFYNGTAAKIGLLTQGHTALLSRSLSGTNKTDEYQFTLDQPTAVYVHNLKSSGDNIVDISQDISSTVGYPARKLFTYSYSDYPFPDGAANSTAITLAPGTYNLEVATGSTLQYIISLEASTSAGDDNRIGAVSPSFVPDLAGNSFDKAFSLNLRKNEHFQTIHHESPDESLGVTMQEDFYKVNLSTSGALQIYLRNQNIEELYLYDANRTFIGRLTSNFYSPPYNNFSNFLTRELTQGTYYIKVSYQNDPSRKSSFDYFLNYDLNLQLN